jgi:hypothetical protein
VRSRSVRALIRLGAPGLFTFSCCRAVSDYLSGQARVLKYLAGQSSELRARPRCYVSYAEVIVGYAALHRAGFGYPRSFGRTKAVSTRSGLLLSICSPSWVLFCGGIGYHRVELRRGMMQPSTWREVLQGPSSKPQSSRSDFTQGSVTNFAFTSRFPLCLERLRLHWRLHVSPRLAP